MGAKGEVVVVRTRLPPHGISSRIRVSKVFSELIRFDTLHLCKVGHCISFSSSRPQKSLQQKFLNFKNIFYTTKCGWHKT